MTDKTLEERVATLEVKTEELITAYYQREWHPLVYFPAALIVALLCAGLLWGTR